MSRVLLCYGLVFLCLAALIAVVNAESALPSRSSVTKPTIANSSSGDQEPRKAIETARAIATVTDCPTGWNTVPSPNIVTATNYLEDIDIIEPNDVWTVGHANYYDGNAHEVALILHWNGTVWSRVPSPTDNVRISYLYAISAIDADDIWAVGTYLSQDQEQVTLTMHWDGTQWTIVPSPNVDDINGLLGVDARASNDVWAVGTARGALTMHWDGTQWTILAAPAPTASQTTLNAVKIISPTAIWAVGYYQPPSGGMFTLSEFWDGTSWHFVPSPNPSAFQNQLWDLAALSPTDIWTVGTTSGTSPQGIVQHWDGTNWSEENIDYAPASLYAISAISPTDIWAVGNTQGAAIAVHWDGTTWTTTRTTPSGLLYGIASVGAYDIWTVGGVTSTTLVKHYLGPCICNVQFTDVTTNNVFYPYIQCMACHDVVAGYPCGSENEPCDPYNNQYFRPSAYITRAQLAKIIAIAAGYVGAPTPPDQVFEDVHHAIPFYYWIQIVAAQGLVQGYPCGSPGEPCVPPNNRPYFRPNNRATRGQISKIVALAANYVDPVPPDQQTFEDVPPNSTFWQWIELLSVHSIIGGYACGPGEPCVPPTNRPYFRPGNNTTRGQLAKITANSFYPNCQTLRPDQKQ